MMPREEALRAALESVIRLIEPIPHSVDVEQAGMQAEVAMATAREALAAAHDVRGHFPYHGYPHPDTHSHEPSVSVEAALTALREGIAAEWSPELDVIEAALRASVTPLDVERVKQAVTNIAVRHGVAKDPPPPEWSLMRFYGYSTTPAKMDAEIAAEYARLIEAHDD